MRLAAIIALLLLAGCQVGVKHPAWECQAVDGGTIIITDAANPATFGGKDTDGWEWSSKQIKVCRTIEVRP